MSFSYVIAPQRALQKKISPFLINIALTLPTQCFYHKIGITEENFISAGSADGNQPNIGWPNTVFLDIQAHSRTEGNKHGTDFVRNKIIDIFLPIIV